MGNKILKSRKSLLFIALIVVFFIGGTVFVANAISPNIKGWLWGGTDDGSGNTTGVGWISANYLNLKKDIVYGISVPENDGVVKGQAWSGNIGWIDFSDAQRQGDNLVGWARILGIAAAKDVGNSGGWEGWIKLNGSSYGVKINPDNSLSGYAWSDELGWIKFGYSSEEEEEELLPVCALSANPGEIPPSEKSILFWDCTDANTCEIDNNIGSVNPDEGNKEVSPALTTIYNLTCSNDYGSGSWDATVKVTIPPSPPPVCSFSANPTQLLISASEKSTLSWQCQNADSCEITGIGSVNPPSGGNIEVSPGSTTKYTLVCSNDGVYRSWSVTIKVWEPTVHE